MWRIWKLYDPLRSMVVQGIFLFGIAEPCFASIALNWAWLSHLTSCNEHCSTKSSESLLQDQTEKYLEQPLIATDHTVSKFST